MSIFYSLTPGQADEMKQIHSSQLSSQFAGTDLHRNASAKRRRTGTCDFKKA
jgi:hypothetical protein